MNKQHEQQIIAIVKAIHRERAARAAAELKATAARESMEQTKKALDGLQNKEKHLRQRLDEIIDGRYWDHNEYRLVEGYRE